MAIILQCPRCMSKQKVDDDEDCAEIRCNVCYAALSIPKGKRAATASATETDAEHTGIKLSRPDAFAGRNRADADDRPRRRREREDDEDYDRRERTRRARSGADSSGMAGLLIGLAIVLAIAVACGGVGLGFVVLRAVPERNPPIAAIEIPPPMPPPPIIPPPPIMPFPAPAEQLAVNDPASLDRALVLLRGPIDQRGPAFRWLMQADPKQPRRPEVAKQLEAIFEEHRDQFGNHDFFSAYFRWATTENVPSLIRVMEGPQPFHKPQAIRTLGKLKDARAIEPLVSRLDDFADRQSVAEALKDIGSIAEPAVLKLFNHRDSFTRMLVRQVLQSYKTDSSVLLTQCVADLDAVDAECRSSALQWIAKCPLDERRRTEVSKALNRCIDDLKGVRGRDALAALDVWATRENVPPLARLAMEGPIGNRDAIRILGKLGGPEATRALADAMTNFFVATDARKILKNIGADAEQPVIDAMMKITDPRMLREYVGLLGEIGTKERSLPALDALAMRMPRDFLLSKQIQQSTQAIQARGK